jgi:hypothetical protein
MASDTKRARAIGLCGVVATALQRLADMRRQRGRVLYRRAPSEDTSERHYMERPR